MKNDKNLEALYIYIEKFNKIKLSKYTLKKKLCILGESKIYSFLIF